MSYNNLRKGRFSEPGREYLITFVTQKREPVFHDFLAARIFVKELPCSEQQHHCQWLAWVLMPDHFHGLLSLGEDGSDCRSGFSPTTEVTQSNMAELNSAVGLKPDLQSENTSLSKIIRTLKGRSAHHINQTIQRKGSLWQPGFHDHALRMEEDRVQVARYIVANPLRARLVKKIGQWPHWDSVWL
ncbi:Transposase and inactivated derivatives [hydrothermal vent metagenome]|uniref:Transposase and inactivated derivatives n=1 Tax=hydrothermal vent metagenome TaxID=652676 RepID=A0A3B1BH82_9ZZZZ